MQKSKVFNETKNIAIVVVSRIAKRTKVMTVLSLAAASVRFFFLVGFSFFFLISFFFLLLNNMMTFLFCVLFLLMIKELDEGPQFQILRKLSQDPVHTAMPSSVTPRQLTRLSWPARTPARSTLSVSQTLTLKSS